MTIQEKQQALAFKAYSRGLIDETLMIAVNKTAGSYDIVETLFALICGELQDTYTAIKFIARMCQYSK